MSGIKLTATDEQRLKGVHPDLIKVVQRAAEITTLPFRVLEGLRSVAQQRENVKRGVSWTMNSRHLTGHAVDIVPFLNGKVSWAWPLYHQLAAVMKQAAVDVGVTIEWGGDWRKTKDGPHFQLPYRTYPAHTGSGFAAITPEEEYEVYSEQPTDPETDTGAATKAVAYAGSAGATAVPIAADPLAKVLDAVVSQQYELSSGDYVRIVVAVVILGMGFYMAFHKAKGQPQ